jgi:hypothetical protein
MLSEPSSNGQPNSLRRSGDERAFAVQIEQFKCHGTTFSKRVRRSGLPSEHRVCISSYAIIKQESLSASFLASSKSVVVLEWIANSGSPAATLSPTCRRRSTPAVLS